MAYNKYPQGYLPKIQYWSNKLVEATEMGDTDAMQTAKSKLDYFYSRQMEKVS